MDQRWRVPIADRSRAKGIITDSLFWVLSGIGAGARHFSRRFGKPTEGAVTVEFAIIISVFLLLIAGIMDFGHAWYMKQVITNASREGARYGITYRTDTNGNRIAPSALSPSISTYLNTNYNLTSLLPCDASPIITTSGNGLNNGTRGNSLEVNVTATKNWFILSSLIPGFGNQQTLTASTVMLCE
jgi:Flp pilus assembly protein TadG